MEKKMKKTKTVLYSIWLTAAVCHFIFLPSLAQSQGGTATLTVGDGSGVPGSQGNQITVALNNNVSVGGMQLEICDEDDFMVCAGCQVQGRASGFLCDLNELSDGCCRMLLVDVTGGGLAEGAGPIFSLDYTVATNAPAGECRTLNPEDIAVRQDNQDLVDTQSEPGEFCFSSSTTTTSTPCPAKEIYGENSQETRLLRSIRDTVLSQTPEGRKIIALYYQWSPAIVKAMKKDKTLAADMRKMLDGWWMLVP
jgi:hypothetical protein